MIISISSSCIFSSAMDLVSLFLVFMELGTPLPPLDDQRVCIVYRGFPTTAEAVIGAP